MVSHAVEDHILPMTKAALQDEDTLMSPSVLKLLSCILEGWPEAALLVQRYRLMSVQSLLSLKLTILSQSAAKYTVALYSPTLICVINLSYRRFSISLR